MDNGVLKSSSSSSGASSSGFSSSAGGNGVGVGLVSPKSPPSGSLDLYGKRRQLVKVQVLEREIALLQEELKDVEVLQPASKCCRELHDFVDGRQDPLVPLKEVPRHLQKPCLCWKQLCLPWSCCISDCQCCQVQLPNCQNCCSCLGRCSCRRRQRGQRQSETTSNSNSSSCCGCWGKPSCKRSNCCSNTTGCCLTKMNPSSWLCCNCTKVKKVRCSSCSNNSCSSCCCCCSCYNPCCCFR